MFCEDRTLVSAMFAQQMRTVLCAGNGISQEPRALAAAGFEVVALDISPRALAIAQECPLRDDVLECFLDPASHRPGGHVEYVVGDILDPAVAPGPFDVVIERRTAQNYPEPEFSLVLSALIARLSPEGILFSHCHDGRWRPPARPRHVTAEWWLARGGIIWDGESRPKPPGQVAMRYTSTG
jgi:SAM-dependent methyltransferase